MNSANTVQCSENSPTLAAVAKEYVQTPIGFQRMAVKPFIQIISWMHIVAGQLSETATSVRKSFKHTDHFVYWIRHPNLIRRCFRSLAKLRDSLSSRSSLTIANKTTKAYISTALVVSLFADAARIFHQEEFITLLPAHLKVVGVVGFAESSAFFLSALYGIKKQVSILRESGVGSPRFKLALIHLTAKVCLAAIGIFGMVTFAIGISISTAAWVSAATLMLVSQLAAHFFEKLYVEYRENFVAT